MIQRDAPPGNELPDSDRDVFENTFLEEAPTYSDDGVDLTLIRWMLSLPPLERLRTAQRYANAARRLQNAPRRLRL